MQPVFGSAFGTFFPLLWLDFRLFALGWEVLELGLLQKLDAGGGMEVLVLGDVREGANPDGLDLVAAWVRGFHGANEHVLVVSGDDSVRLRIGKVRGGHVGAVRDGRGLKDRHVTKVGGLRPMKRILKVQVHIQQREQQHKDTQNIERGHLLAHPLLLTLHISLDGHCDLILLFLDLVFFLRCFGPTNFI